jgi:hypothetical protein
MSNQDLLGISKHDFPVKNGDSTLALSNKFKIIGSTQDPSVLLTVLVQRIGNMMYAQGSFILSSPSVSIGLYLQLPNGLTLDRTKFITTDLVWKFGNAVRCTASGTPDYITTDGDMTTLTFDNSKPNAFYFNSRTSSGAFNGGQAASNIGNTNDRIVFDFKAPIKEWRE